MNQAKLRQLAEERILDAAALIAAGRWSYAYYTAGYAVECALKACVLARIVETGWIFSEPKVKIEDVFTHSFDKLVRMRERFTLESPTTTMGYSHGFGSTARRAY